MLNIFSIVGKVRKDKNSSGMTAYKIIAPFDELLLSGILRIGKAPGGIFDQRVEVFIFGCNRFEES